MDNDLNITDLVFSFLNDVACYTQNNSTNKSMEAIKREKIINALFELEENIHKIIRQLNAYDASSILVSESNWIKRNHFSKYMPAKGTLCKVNFGQVCTVDYGKTYKGEIGYIHPGLCIGKKNDKYLIIPMTTGATWRKKCYHPVHNPNMTKETRQSCMSEGFSKDGVLLISDAKFVSGGRILELHDIITANALLEIQEQLMEVMFPVVYTNLTQKLQMLESLKSKQENTIKNYNGRIKNQNQQIDKLSKKIIVLQATIDRLKITQMDTND